jgi:hypothetical protein
MKGLAFFLLIMAGALALVAIMMNRLSGQSDAPSAPKASATNEVVEAPAIEPPPQEPGGAQKEPVAEVAAPAEEPDPKAPDAQERPVAEQEPTPEPDASSPEAPSTENTPEKRDPAPEPEQGGKVDRPQDSQPQEPVIELYGQAGHFAWGTSADRVRKKIHEAFSRRGNEIMIQTVPQNGTTYRYFFGDDGLYKVQVRHDPGEEQEVDAVHEHLMKVFERRYGHLPNSRRTSWDDDFTALRLSLDRQMGWVQLEYQQL